MSSPLGHFSQVQDPVVLGVVVLRQLFAGGEIRHGLCRVREQLGQLVARRIEVFRVHGLQVEIQHRVLSHVLPAEILFLQDLKAVKERGISIDGEELPEHVQINGLAAVSRAEDQVCLGAVLHDLAEKRKTAIRAGKLDLKQVLDAYRLKYFVLYGSTGADMRGRYGCAPSRHFWLFSSPIGDTFYVDPETREESQMDIWIEIPGQRYIVEVRDWSKAHITREDAKTTVMREYLDRYNLQEGYLLGYNEQFVSSFMEKNPKQYDIDGRTVVKAEV